MKTFIKNFLIRGLSVSAGGPIILAIIYYFIGRSGAAENISIYDASLAIISITVMAFIAGGITAIYQCEKLPLAFSILIHAAILYLDYLVIYLLNDWIPRIGNAIQIFTVIFFTCFGLIWFIIYLCIKHKTDGINKLRSKEK